MASVVKSRHSIGGQDGAVAATNVDGGEAAVLAFVPINTSGEVAYEQFDVTTTTLVVETGALADNDVCVIPQEITGVFGAAGRCIVLESVHLLDEDDQGVDLELIFLNATGSIGALNATYAPTDTVARTILGTVLLTAAAHYSIADVNQTATRSDLRLVMKGATTSLWVGVVVRSGTPTYTASGLKLKLGFRRV